jgi:hypothetical protein
MKSKLCVVFILLGITGCGSVGDTVLQDFGIQERPEDYQSGSDTVIKAMENVGATELRRLNLSQRRGTVTFQKKELSTLYYKTMKKYTRSYPLDANAKSRNSQSKSKGFVGYIEYSYEIYESARFINRVDAQAAPAEIPAGERGREVYSYNFTTSGSWNGQAGKLVSR